MKNFFLIAFLLVFTSALMAQAKELQVKSGNKGVYLEHVVEAKEGLFAIGRLYNVHPRLIASFNEIDFNKGLDIGQVLNIPLTDTNFTQKTRTGAPVYYRVGNGESLNRVSEQANKIPPETLRQWNGISGDNIQAGTKLIVGYLTSGEMKDMLAAKTENSKTTVPLPAEKNEEAKLVAKSEPEKKEIGETKKEETAGPKNPVPAVMEVVQKPSQQGYFRIFFEQQVSQSPATNEKTMNAGIFKTISGWQDGKYYALIDNVEPGSIIKILNPVNGKKVYAKVLGKMEGINLNAGLNIRISNSAASMLNIPEEETGKFIVQVNY